MGSFGYGAMPLRRRRSDVYAGMPHFSIASFNSSSIFDISITPFHSHATHPRYASRITHTQEAKPFRRPHLAAKQGKFTKPPRGSQELFSKFFRLTFKIPEGNLISWNFGNFHGLFTVILAVVFCNLRLKRRAFWTLERNGNKADMDSVRVLYA